MKLITFLLMIFVTLNVEANTNSKEAMTELKNCVPAGNPSNLSFKEAAALAMKIAAKGKSTQSK